MTINEIQREFTPTDRRYMTQCSNIRDSAASFINYHKSKGNKLYFLTFHYKGYDLSHFKTLIHDFFRTDVPKQHNVQVYGCFEEELHELGRLHLHALVYLENDTDYDCLFKLLKGAYKKRIGEHASHQYIEKGKHNGIVDYKESESVINYLGKIVSLKKRQAPFLPKPQGRVLGNAGYSYSFHFPKEAKSTPTSRKHRFKPMLEHHIKETDFPWVSLGGKPYPLETTASMN